VGLRDDKDARSVIKEQPSKCFSSFLSSRLIAARMSMNPPGG